MFGLAGGRVALPGDRCGSVGEVPLRIYPGGIKTTVAWHEVPGKKKKDASSPVGRLIKVSCKCVGGVADHVHLLLSTPTTMAIAKAHDVKFDEKYLWD
ncbi:MAG TPA: hypothetical protein VE860_09780 [Chthoniobacterales bacterium]|jgi:hypothetical protein|nr:hypothetical protein [Chthoniobacterales bacterium]